MKLYKFVRGLARVIFKLIYRIRVHGKENIPGDGRLIIGANHSHVLDPVVLALAIPREISFMGKKELFENKFLNYIFTNIGAFPVDRDGTDIKAVKNSLRVLQNDGVLGIFPEGTRVTGYDEDNAKAGMAMISLRAKSGILPVYIESSYRIFSRIDVYIGEPIDLSEHYGERLSSEEYSKISKDILKKIYTIK